MKNLKHLLPSNLHFYAIGVVMVMLIESKTYMFVLFCMYVFMLRYHKQLIYILMFSLFAYIYQYGYKQIDVKPHDTYIVVYEDDYKYTLKQGLCHYNLITSETLEIGDVIKIEVKPYPYDFDRYEGGYNAYNYNRSKGIHGYFDSPDLEYLRTTFTFEGLLTPIYRYVQSLPVTTQAFVKSLVLGENGFEDKTLFSHLGIAHLFVLSGLHVTLMIGVLDYILKPIKKTYRLILYYPVLFFYLCLTRFPFSLMRAIFAFLIYETLIKLKIPITKLDALSLTLILLFIINPYMLYQLGFILSFLVSLFFILEKPNEGFFGLLKHTIYIQILIIPIVSIFQDHFYPISLLISPIILLLFTYTVLPLAWVSLIAPLGHRLNEGFLLFLEALKQIEWQQIYVKLPVFNLWQTSVYMAIWLLIYLGRKPLYKAIGMGFLCAFILGIPHLDFNETTTVTFLDVGQGDTTIIKSPKHDCVVIIDAFGDIKTYLRNNHIESIDYLLITHGDYDHYKETLNVLNTVDVDIIGINAFETGKLIELIEPHDVVRLKSNDQFTCGLLEFEVLGPIKNYASRNNNSLVLQVDIDGIRYLFTGDIEVEAEKDLIKKYGKTLKSDILKVPHHGSETSSSMAFLEAVSPKIAMISAGRNNDFSHPHPSVLNRYQTQMVDVYQTKLDYTLTVSHESFRKYVLKVHKNKNM